MSYLLRNPNRLSKPEGGTNNKLSSLRPHSLSSSSLGIQRSSLGGGGQVQIQRLQPQQNVPPQQRQHVQGVISMEEVMADLRILEAQQQESEQKLHHAKVTKKSRLEYQSALEEKLDKCKYHNGQLGAELKRSQELLSEGHRQVNEARKTSIKEGNDLREYDIKVTNALGIKEAIVAHQRTQETWIRKLKEKAALIEEVLHKSEQEFHTSKHEFEKAKDLEDTLRLDIMNENISQQRIVEQMTKLSSEISSYERKFETLSSLQSFLKQKIETADTEAVELDSRHAEFMVRLDALQAEQVKIHEEREAEHVDLKKSIMNKNEQLHQLWRNIVEIQKSEGHDPSPLPSESDTIPVLDLDRIRHSLQVQLDANAAEKKAKEEIDESIQDLSTQLADLHLQHEKDLAQIAKMRASNTKAKQVKNDRRAARTLHFANYEKIRKDVEAKESRVRALQFDRKIEMDDLNKELERLTDVTSDMKAKHAMCKDKNIDLEGEIMAIQGTRDQLKEANETKLLDKERELKDVRGSIVTLQKECTNKSNTFTDTAGTSVDEQECWHQIDEANQRVAKILHEYPELEQLDFNYRPDLSDREQAAIDLKKHAQKCNKRDRVTESKIAALESAKVLSKSAMKQTVVRSTSTDGGQLVQKSFKHGEKVTQESTSKPRALLTTFLSASQNENNESYGMGSDSDDDDAVSKPINPKLSRKTNVVSHNSEKKVRWEHDNVKANHVTKKKVTDTTLTNFQKAKGSSMRQSFGSSDKTKTNDSRTNSVNKVQVEKENATPLVARSTTSKPLSGAKIPSVSNERKKRSSSRQMSGISSQERSSKGRRRKNSQAASGASVGHDHDFYDDYNFSTK